MLRALASHRCSLGSIPGTLRHMWIEFVVGSRPCFKGTFTPLVFTTTGGMADECLRYHSRLAELLSAKKQESYATTISWVRVKVSFAILRSALLCLKGSRTPRRRNLDIKDSDLEIEKGQAGLP